MEERALITGGAGFIGLHLAKALLAQGVQVTLLDNFSRGRLDRDLQAILDNVTLIEHDLTQPIPDTLLRTDYTHIYHMAAIVGVHISNEKPQHVLRTNVLATIHLLDWCSRHSKATLCFASTSEVYAGSVKLDIAPIPTPETVPLTILDTALPRYSYLSSKIVGEQLCLSYAQAYGFPVRIVRYHNVYGPRMGYDHVIPQFIQRLLERENPFPIYGAYQTRAFCYVDDAVEATLQLMHAALPGPLTVNIGNDQEEIQILALAQKLFHVSECYPQTAIYAPPPGSPERRCPDITQLQHVTSYTPGVPLAQGLQKIYAWYQAEHERQSRSQLSSTTL
ncbi:MAG TPA: NAD-dependent epimerase/dehydratase family protein [Ktedonobacteraceae bacterium]|nr:NAD-dependent epimerase/dehydratase family protein [Ktedonobacteraceae bacterium]